MTFKSLIALSFFALMAPLAGCSAESASTATGEEDIASLSDDALVELRIGERLEGLMTSGGEGERDPYKLLVLDLPADQPLTDALILTELLPKMIEGEDGMSPGLQEASLDDAWSDVTADPDPDFFESEQELAAEQAAVVNWRKMKVLFDEHLTGARRVTLGYAFSPGGSIETGAVARVFVGRSATGRVYAIWGVDIWT